MDGDGVTVLDEQEVEYGSYATIPEDVTPASVSTVNTEDYDTEFTKQFLGWSPNPLTTQITQNTEFKPTFSENNVTVRSYQGKIVDAYNALTVGEGTYSYDTYSFKVKKLASATSVTEANVGSVDLNFGLTEGNGSSKQNRVFVYHGTAEVTLEPASGKTKTPEISGTLTYRTLFNKDGLIEEGTSIYFQTEASAPTSISMKWENLDLVATSDRLECPTYSTDSAITNNIVTNNGEQGATDAYENSFYETAHAIYKNFIEDKGYSFFNNAGLNTPY